MSINPTRYVEVSANGSPVDPQAQADLAAASAAGAIAGDIAGRAAGAEAGAQAGTEVAASAGAAAGAAAGEIAGRDAGTAAGATAGTVAGAAAGTAAAGVVVATKADKNGGNVAGADATAFLTAIGNPSGLTAAADVADADLLTVWRSSGPIKKLTAAILGGYVVKTLEAFIAAGVGAVARTVQDKNRDWVDARDFGLVAGSATSVQTAAFVKASDYAFTNKKTLRVTGGDYVINGPTSTRSQASGSMIWQLDGPVKITVDPASTVFDSVVGYLCADVADFIITGSGSLYIDGSNAVSSGLYMRHTSTTYGGAVSLSAPVSVINIRGDASMTNNTGILALGRFTSIYMNLPRVENVSRLVSGGECSGINCQQYVGEVEICSPYVSNINSGAFSTDADGIKVFGLSIGTAQNERIGSSVVSNPTLVNCQGRSYKSQDSHSRVVAPLVQRDAAVMVSNPDCTEFDFQFGNGELEDPRYEFKKKSLPPSDSGTATAGASTTLTDGGKSWTVNAYAGFEVRITAGTGSGQWRTITSNTATVLTVTPAWTTTPDATSVYEVYQVTSPVQTSTHSFVAFQQTLDNAAMCGKALNGTVVSDIQVNRYALVTQVTSSAISETVVDGVDIVPSNGFAGGMFARAVVETSMAQVAAKSTETIIRVKNIRGPNTAPLLGYTGFITGTHDVSAKMTWDVGQGCINPLGPSGSNSAGFRPVSGSPVLAVKQFRNIPAEGYIDSYLSAGFVCDFKKLTVGTCITVDIATGAFTNPPAWGVSGYAHIRVEGQWSTGNFRKIWVVKDGATASPSCWFTQNSGGAWGALN